MWHYFLRVHSGEDMIGLEMGGHNTFLRSVTRCTLYPGISGKGGDVGIGGGRRDLC